MTSPLFVFPTRNIHLVLDPADQIDLSICMDWPPRRVAMAWTDLSTLNGPIINASQHPAPGPNDVVPADALKRPTSPTGISFVPKAVGSAFYVVHVNKSALILSTVVRVAVHNKVTDLYLPYGEIPMFVGRSDIVLTVFARFDDGEAWDVSEHPYLEFKSDDPTVASVETGVGRITARARGETKVWVRVRGQPQDPYKYVVIRVSSIEDAVASGDIAAKYLQRPAKATRRLFLVSEGFVERDRFEQRADEIAERIFGEANTPFRWLKSHFDVIRIYVGSWGTRGSGSDHPSRSGRCLRRSRTSTTAT